MMPLLVHNKASGPPKEEDSSSCSAVIVMVFGLPPGRDLSSSGQVLPSQVVEESISAMEKEQVQRQGAL